MEILKELKLNGEIPTYRIENELENLTKVSEKKPSSRIIRTKKGRNAIAGLVHIEHSHNTSWYTELKKRTAKNPNGIALFYRGTKITFKEMFENGNKMAHAMLAAGIKKGDEIPVCLSNTPELVYIMLASNIIGAKLNLFSSHFDKEYINEILDGCSKKLFIGTDDTFSSIENIVASKNITNTILISLADSLPKQPELCDEYEKDLDEYYHYQNLVPQFKKRNPNIQSYEEFVSKGQNNTSEIDDENNLDTEFIITYTSGSTKVGRPKQLIHTNRSFITMGVFHDPELCGNPHMPNFRALAHIHTDSNTNLITSISDSLMQEWTVALEPEYDKKKALDYLIINKANQVSMTTSFWVETAKQYLIEKRHHEDGKGKKLPFLFAGLAVGEKTSKGEEKFINKFFRVARAGSGVKIKGLSLPFTSIGIGGGDCEHGGIYYTLWHSLYENLYKLKLPKKEYGMCPVPFVHITALRPTEDQKYEECEYNEYGIIVANSPVTMKKYKNNPEATEALVLTDELNRDWISSNVYGYIDNLGTVHVKGRVGGEILLKDGTILLPFMIEESVEEDTKNILSCTLTTYEEEIILNIEFQPDAKKKKEEILLSIEKRLAKKYPSLQERNIHIRVIPNEQSFPLTGSGKRNVRALENRELQNTIQLNNLPTKQKLYLKKR